jgi:TPR repeat protein/WD40 repeat protein
MTAQKIGLFLGILGIGVVLNASDFPHQYYGISGAAVVDLDYQPSIKNAIVVGDSGVGKWNLQSSKIERSVRSDTKITTSEIDSNARFIAYSNGNQIIVKNVENGNAEMEKKAYVFSVLDVSWAERDRYLVTVGIDKFSDDSEGNKITHYTVKLWDVRSGYKVKDLATSTDPITLVKGSDVGELVAFSGKNTLKIVDLRDGKVTWTLGKSDGILHTPTSIDFNEDGGLIAIGDEKGNILVGDTRSRKIISQGKIALKHLPENDQRIRDIEFSPNSQYVAVAYSNVDVVLSQTATNLTTLWVEKGPATSVSWSRDDQKVLVGLQSPDGKNIVEFHVSNLDLEKRITSKMALIGNEWKSKKSFERDSEYTERIKNEGTVTNKMLGQLYSIYRPIIQSSVALGDYKDRLRSYFIKLPLFNEIIMKVDPEDHREFQAEFPSLKVNDIKVSDTNNPFGRQLVLNSLEFIDEQQVPRYFYSRYPRLEEDKKFHYKIDHRFDDHRRRAERFEIVSLAKLSSIYRLGEGVQANYDFSLQFAQSASSSNHPIAWYNIAVIYKDGLGVAEDGQKVQESVGRLLETVKNDEYKNDEEVLFILGEMYDQGFGVSQNYDIAFDFYRRSADRNFHRAQYRLAQLHEDGLGTKRDDRQSINYTRRAAENGNKWAQTDLGLRYKFGDGLNEDIEEAIRWIHKAALQGDVEAMTMLGDMIRNGEGTTTDYESALHWYKKAADSGYDTAKISMLELQGSPYFSEETNAKALAELEIMANNGDIDAQISYSRALLHQVMLSDDLKQKGHMFISKAVAKNDSAAVVAAQFSQQFDVKLDDTSLAALERVAEQGDAQAQFLLGAYLNKTNDDEAQRWLELSADQNNPDAQLMLAKLNVSSNPRKALTYSQMAAYNGSPEAAKMLSDLLLNSSYKNTDLSYYWGSRYAQLSPNNGEWFNTLSEMFPLNSDELKWLYKAAGNGNTNAQYKLGVKYEKRAKYEVDRKRAYHWLKRAADSAHAKAQFQLAQLVETYPELRPSDNSEIMRWIVNAAENGDEDAHYKVATYYLSDSAVLKNPARAIVLLDAENYQDEIAELDNTYGLAFLREIGFKADSFEMNMALEKSIADAFNAYEAGVANIGEKIIDNHIKEDDDQLFNQQFWYIFVQRNVPLKTLGEMVTHLKEEMKGDPKYWAMVAHIANQAGESKTALDAVNTGLGLSKNYSDSYLDFMAIQHANALVQSGKSQDGYEALFDRGTFSTSSDWVINYINKWASPLLSNKKSLSFVTKISEDKWIGEASVWLPQEFLIPGDDDDVSN